MYKVHTIGDSYVVMGYNGKTNKHKRNNVVIVEETQRVLKTGLEMLAFVQELTRSSDNEALKGLQVKAGVHTGRVVAGLIGQKLVHYDIFGEGVLIANKMEKYGVPGKVCVSEDTR